MHSKTSALYPQVPKDSPPPPPHSRHTLALDTCIFPPDPRDLLVEIHGPLVFHRSRKCHCLSPCRGGLGEVLGKEGASSSKHLQLQLVVVVQLLCSALSHSVMSDSLPPWTLSMGFSRQEYWSGLPCPFPVHLPNPGIEPRSPSLQADSLPSEPPAKSCLTLSRPPGLYLSRLFCPWDFPGKNTGVGCHFFL